ncbi:aldehyde dehydrogenase family protein [Kordia sp.]|uniref:aldehyde dehydrogenase family protein n=1 Tax=Kordia sp. TaxID=1965332 RepID=UPI0025BA71AE|nr:aldehyde dehydrogenase family protein [Kordia sp.]
MCTAAERIYVHESIKEEFENQVTNIASQYQIGTWDDPNTNVFPIINDKQRTNIISHIQDAIDKGAKVLLGGTEHPEHFVKPTVLTNVPESAIMESEETFGPVISISSFNSVEEVVERANNSRYGLGASVYGNANVNEIAQQLEAGMVGVNKPAGASPWVGAKQSGFGFHGSVDGHRQFTQVKVIN